MEDIEIRQLDEGWTRRDFLGRSLMGSGALVLGVGLSACASGDERAPQLTRLREAGSTPPGAGPEFAPDAFIRIGRDDTITILSKHLEMGQGPYTGLATLIAEELDADWSKVRAIAAPADDALYANTFRGVQGTGGSTAIANSYDQMRMAGAAARHMLVEAAAETWGVPAEQITASKGVLSHRASGRRGLFGEFVEAAATRPVPKSPRLKSPEEFVLIGHEAPRLDSAAKSDGSAQFAIDVYRDDMLVVMIERPTVFGARVKRVRSDAALAVPGVVAVRTLSQGVAVYAEETWAAIQGRRALEVEWDESAGETRSSEELFATFRKAAGEADVVAAERGSAATAVAEAAARTDVHVVEAEYAFPFLAHAMMEPLDGLIEVDPEGDGRAVLVTIGSQGPGRDRPAIAKRLGLPIEQVRFDITYAGGSFGRRSQFDAQFPIELADVFTHQPGAPADRRPTKLLWTREDDIRGGYYRPMVVHRLRGAISQSGELVGWDQSIAAQSFFPEAIRARLAKNGVDPTVVEGASNLAYATANLSVRQRLVETGVPVLWWRSVGHTHTGFAVEAFIDELLERAGRDPVEGRLALLADHPRHRGVLERAAEIAGWGRAPDSGRAFGVAVHESFSSFVAQIVEISLERSPVRRPRVHRVWCAVDCGVPVNPNVIRAQMEGGIGFGLGAALYSEIRLGAGGRVIEGNFDAYRSLRLDDMPEVEVAILPSTEKPTGVGEPGVPPIAPAVANAWRRLTGERVSQLPFVRST